MRRLPPALIAISAGDGATLRADSWLDRIVRARRGGLGALILREPELADADVLERARRLRATLGREFWIAIHDRVHLAPAAEADAVHLGFRSLSPADARQILPEEIAIGISGHAPDDPGSWDPCDWVLFGPVLDTPSKRGIVEPTGFDGLARAVSASRRPVWALGGLGPEHCAAARAAGARGVAAVRAILGAADPEAACARFAAALPRNGSEPSHGLE